MDLASCQRKTNCAYSTNKGSICMHWYVPCMAGAFVCPVPLAVLTDAAGNLILIQMIWQGSTDVVHAKPDVAHPKIVQDNQPASHYQVSLFFFLHCCPLSDSHSLQNKDTYDRLCDRLIEHVKAVREHLNFWDQEALLIADAAPQHVHGAKLKDAGIRHVQIPKNMRHVFQPADQFVICGLRQSTLKAWDDWVEGIFAANANDLAVAEMSISHLPTVRRRKYALIAAAVDHQWSFFHHL